MGDLTENFSRSEFSCHCKYPDCDGKTPTVSLLPIAMALEKIRETIGIPVVVYSGYRCRKHNADQGSQETSQHRKGLAADLHTADHPGWTTEQLYDIAKSIPDFKGLGIYNGFIHVDVRPGARKLWDER